MNKKLEIRYPEFSNESNSTFDFKTILIDKSEELHLKSHHCKGESIYTLIDHGNGYYIVLDGKKYVLDYTKIEALEILLRLAKLLLPNQVKQKFDMYLVEEEKLNG